MTEFKFNLPDVGEGLSEGELVRWLVKPGDTVAPDQILAEVETDKAVVEIPSPVAGVVKTLGGAPGDVIPIGRLLLVIEVPEGTRLPQQKDHGHDASHASPPPPPARGEALAPPPAKTPNKTPNTAPDKAPAKAAPAPAAPSAPARPGRVLAAPATRKLAVELGVDLTAVAGSGPGGRVTREDVEQAAKGSSTGSTTGAAASARAEPASPLAGGRPAPRAVAVPPPDRKDEVIALRGLRRRIAQTMTDSLQIPHIMDWLQTDASKLVAARDSLKEDFAREGVKLTFLPFFVKACVAALKQFPSFNATLDVDKGEIVHRKRYNIGLATATPEGLIVPVIHDADMKSIFDLAIEIAELAEQTRTRRVAPERLAGGTFNITNFGSYGAKMGTPIIAPPHVAIAGFGAIHEACIPVDGQPAVRAVLPIIVSTDHRLNDGKDLGTFVLTLANLLGDPVRLLGRL